MYSAQPSLTFPRTQALGPLQSPICHCYHLAPCQNTGHESLMASLLLPAMASLGQATGLLGLITRVLASDLQEPQLSAALRRVAMTGCF